MRKRLISVYIVVILVCGIYGCARATEDTFVAEKENVEIKNTDAETAVAEEDHEQDEEETKLIADAAEQTGTAQRQWQVYIQPGMPEPFVEVLKQYEEFMNTDIQVLNGDTWYDEVRGYLCDELCLSLKSLLKDSTEESDIDAFRYSLKDLTGDGFPELIMGHYLDIFDETWLYVVYYYSETEGIKMEWHSWYFNMRLYEGGVIEYGSAGMDYSMTYYRFQEETESWEKAACIIVKWDSQSDSYNYYRGVNLANFSDPVNEPMTEEEYQEIIERYTAEPVELEWTPMFESDSNKYFYADYNISNGQGSIEQIGEEEYKVTLYDKDHNEVFSKVYSKSPWFTMITDNIWEIGISVGTNATYTFYFDTETAEISDTYFNPRVFGDKYIAYMEADVIGADEITLTLSDIFKKGILHQEIVRDFSVCADPMSSIMSVEMIDDMNIRLEYLEGTDHTTVSETIKLEWAPAFCGEASEEK